MTLTNFIILTLIAVALSVGVMFLIRRMIPPEDLRSHHDVTDPLLAVLGTLFAILLGFMVANAMERFESARSNVQQEAGAIGDIFRLAGGLPQESKQLIRKDVLEYIDLVINEEFPLMANGKFSDRAWNTYGQIWQDCIHYQPQTNCENNLHQMIVSAMSRAGECRRNRFAQIRYSLPPTLWVVLCFGGLSTIVFTYFFAIENTKLQMAMTGVITSIICLNIYMLAGFDAPFSGDIAISPAAFEAVRESLQRVQKHELK